jgi:hypothetical protein
MRISRFASFLLRSNLSAAVEDLFTLRFRNLKIELHGIVRGCRVVAIKPRPTYISRLQFVDVSETARESLDCAT